MVISRRDDMRGREAWEKYADKYIEGVERIHAIGGFPLVAFALGFLMIGIPAVVLAFVQEFQSQTSVVVSIIVCGGLIALAGIAMHVLEVRHKEAAFEKSLDNFHSMTAELWRVYLEKLKNRDVIDSSQMNASITDLNNILNSREEGV